MLSTSYKQERYALLECITHLYVSIIRCFTYLKWFAANTFPDKRLKFFLQLNSEQAYLKALSVVQ